MAIQWLRLPLGCLYFVAPVQPVVLVQSAKSLSKWLLLPHFEFGVYLRFVLFDYQKTINPSVDVHNTWIVKFTTKTVTLHFQSTSVVIAVPLPIDKLTILLQKRQKGLI